jgi:hypothetical protein
LPLEEEEDDEDEDDGSDRSLVSDSQHPKKKPRVTDDHDSLGSFPSVPPSPSSMNEVPPAHSSSRSAALPVQRRSTAATADPPGERTIFGTSDGDEADLEDDVFQTTPRNASQSSKRPRSNGGRPSSKGSSRSRGSSGRKKKGSKKSKKAKTSSSSSYSALAPMQGNQLHKTVQITCALTLLWIRCIFVHVFLISLILMFSKF